MSLVVSWIAAHSSAASLYFAADSRISWQDGSRWDHAQKVFSSPQTNEVFAYAGDVIFPTQTLGQLCQIAHTGVLFGHAAAAEDRAKIYFNILQSAFASYPQHCLAERFDVLYAHCSNGQFALFRIEYTSENQTSLSREDIPEKSGPIRVLGSGRKLFNNQYEREPRTSWGVFHAFGKVLDAEIDKKVGGVPQVVSLYSNGQTNLYGLSYYGSKGLLGLDASAATCPVAVNWRNENFERWDPRTGTLIAKTQRQPRLDV